MEARRISNVEVEKIEIAFGWRRIIRVLWSPLIFMKGVALSAAKLWEAGAEQSRHIDEIKNEHYQKYHSFNMRM